MTSQDEITTTMVWQQVSLHFATWSAAETVAATDLAPVLDAAEADGLINTWFYLRKAPCWRVRYRVTQASTAVAATYLSDQLDRLRDDGRITAWPPAIYEPETHAFGGQQAMHVAHDLFHQDSKEILAYLRLQQHHDSATTDRRRELSIMLGSALLRAARLDWYEQGDVWARVADHRDLAPDLSPRRIHALQPLVKRLMTVDLDHLTTGDGPLATISAWSAAFRRAGERLWDMASSGSLHRGLRAVLAHHILFAWNRIGLSHGIQSQLAHAAKGVVFAE